MKRLALLFVLGGGWGYAADEWSGLAVGLAVAAATELFVMAIEVARDAGYL